MTRPAKLVVISIEERARKRAQPVTLLHAAHPHSDSPKTLCGRHSGLQGVLRFDLTDERWPKHWPSTDNRLVCAPCVAASELLWRRADREPNVDLLNASTLLKRLATELTPTLADVKDALASIGFPTSSDRGGGGVADDTGYEAVKVQGLLDWIDAVRDVKEQVIDGVHELDRLIGRQRPRGAATTDAPAFCGDNQQKMTDKQKAGWTTEIECRRYGTRSDGLCDRCGKRADRAKVAA